MKLTAIAHALLSRAFDLSPDERGQVFDELFDSLAGHDELDDLMDELERRGDLASEPDMVEIERRLRSLEEPAGGAAWSTGDELLEALSRRLAETHAARAQTTRSTPEPRLPGKVGDLVGAALALSPSERGALARAILATIERCDAAPDERIPEE